jgi:galactokinase/mevalonate kinase-like predicted kinase
VQEESTLQFVEQALFLLPLGPREADYDVLAGTNIDEAHAKALSDATENCWEAILNHDIITFGASFRQAFEAQVTMFPNMWTESVGELIDQYRDQALGWKLSGAGGGGYLIFVADHEIENAIRIVIRRKEELA